MQAESVVSGPCDREVAYPYWEPPFLRDHPSLPCAQLPMLCAADDCVS